MIIYHIVLPEVWSKFKDKDFYEAESLQTEGFIHCSFAEQIETVLNRYYKDTERVLLLEIETEKLTSELINEPSTGGEIYPHIYGKINKKAITKTEERSL
ncbi:MAG: DUF952 domain-containing protein [Acidobacteria bacterium]|jgi:uncharacterized protein (DUF952 family)|nr:DUF952 domain-containing protein [Acidobacteriota bacterium]MBA4182881.1 DUF952 domain-containing protein [Acidobacteriota bacterium]